MHHIYHTDAIILSSENSGEADKNFLLYTKELGFIYAKAQGIRYEKSKLRFALQTYSLARLSLVKGKAVWRITTATPLALFYNKEVPTFVFETFQNVTNTLKELVPGEIPDKRIFEDLRNAFLYMSGQKITNEQVKDVELCLLLRILYYLGYVAESKDFADILEDTFSFYTFLYQNLSKKKVVQTINNALFATAR